MTLTVREQAVEGLQTLLQGIVSTNPPSDPYGEQFSPQSVYREPPKTIASGRRAVGVITEVAESKTELDYGAVNCELTVYVEIHVLRQPNENMSSVLNNFLGIVERVIRADRTFGVPNMFDTMILGNEVAIEGGPYANYGSCVVKMKMFYRHSTLDPRF